MQGNFWGAGLLGFIRVRGYRFEAWRDVGYLPFLKITDILYRLLVSLDYIGRERRYSAKKRS